MTATTPREFAAEQWGANYTPPMDAEMTILERGGLTLADAKWALDLLDRASPRDEWGYFRHCCLQRAADRVVVLREVALH